MKRKSTPGFALLELVLVVAIIALIVGVAVFALNGSKKSNKNSDAEKSKTPALQNDTLILKNLGVASLDSVAVDPAATRDFTASGHKGLYVFGDILPGTPVRQNPNFEFASMKEGTELISALDGIVAFIRQQPETNDYEVFIAPSEQSQWVVGYDHVVNLVVKKGDKVKAGQKVGKPARQNNGLLRYELQINKGKDDNALSICPSTLLDSSVRPTILAQLSAIQTQWESVSGLELYNVASQDPIGCIKKQLTPAEASGT